MPANKAIMVILARAGIPSVIPAQAGIQWFIQSIPAKREWLLRALSRHSADRQTLVSIYHPGAPSWIPAFAGMTTEG